MIESISSFLAQSVNCPQKFCKKCKRTLPLSKFYFSPWKGTKQTYYYYSSPCKECKSKTCNKWASKNKDIVSLTKKRYLVNHPKKRKESLHNWYLKKKRLKPWSTTYFAANQRCNNPNHTAFKYYGGRGIKMLLTMSDFEFLWKRDKAFLMIKPSIDRIDTDGDYTLKNCQFIEQSENSRKDCVFFGHN